MDDFLMGPQSDESILEKHHGDDSFFTGEFDPYEEEREGQTYPLTHRERGRLGGLATLAKYGHAYFIELAKKGGEAYNKKYVAPGLHAGRNTVGKDDHEKEELPY